MPRIEVISSDEDDEIWDYRSQTQNQNTSLKKSTQTRQPSSKPKSKVENKIKAKVQPNKRTQASAAAGTSHIDVKPVIKDEGTRYQPKTKTNPKKNKVKTELKVEATPDSKHNVDRSGRCPICQMPFSILSKIETPSWHVDQCIVVPYSSKNECLLGLECKSEIGSHYKKFRHTQIARSRRKSETADGRDTGSVEGAKAKLCFDAGDSKTKLWVPGSNVDCVIELDSSSDTSQRSNSDSIDREPVSKAQSARATRSDDCKKDKEISAAKGKSNNRKPNKFKSDENKNFLKGFGKNVPSTKLKSETKSIDDMSSDDDDITEIDNQHFNDKANLDDDAVTKVNTIDLLDDSSKSVQDINDLLDESRSITDMINDALASDDECKTVEENNYENDDIFGSGDENGKQNAALTSDNEDESGSEDILMAKPVKASAIQRLSNELSSSDSNSSTDWEILRNTLTQPAFGVKDRLSKKVVSSSGKNNIKDHTSIAQSPEIFESINNESLKTPKKSEIVGKRTINEGPSKIQSGKTALKSVHEPLKKKNTQRATSQDKDKNLLKDTNKTTANVVKDVPKGKPNETESTKNQPVLRSFFATKMKMNALQKKTAPETSVIDTVNKLFEDSDTEESSDSVSVADTKQKRSIRTSAGLSTKSKSPGTKSKDSGRQHSVSSPQRKERDMFSVSKYLRSSPRKLTQVSYFKNKGKPSPRLKGNGENSQDVSAEVDTNMESQSTKVDTSMELQVLLSPLKRKHPNNDNNRCDVNIDNSVPQTNQRIVDEDESLIPEKRSKVENLTKNINKTSQQCTKHKKTSDKDDSGSDSNNKPVDSCINPNLKKAEEIAVIIQTDSESSGDYDRFNKIHKPVNCCDNCVEDKKSYRDYLSKIEQANWSPEFNESQTMCSQGSQKGAGNISRPCSCHSDANVQWVECHTCRSAFSSGSRQLPTVSQTGSKLTCHQNKSCQNLSSSCQNFCSDTTTKMCSQQQHSQCCCYCHSHYSSQLVHCTNCVRSKCSSSQINSLNNSRCSVHTPEFNIDDVCTLSQNTFAKMGGGFIVDSDVIEGCDRVTCAGDNIPCDTQNRCDIDTDKFALPASAKQTMNTATSETSNIVSEDLEVKTVLQIRKSAMDILMASSKLLYSKSKTAVSNLVGRGKAARNNNLPKVKIEHETKSGDGMQVSHPEPVAGAGRGHKGQGWNHRDSESTDSSSVSSRSQNKQCPFYKKIPGTWFTVDAFKYGNIPDCRAYILSHFHYDHYGGLNKHFKNPIYCSKITGNLVKKKIGVDSRYIHSLPLNTPAVVENVEITFLEANHCPGAVLIIFKLKSGKVYLHTGDFRASSAMELYPDLHNLKVNTLYLDTTYCDPQYDFPPQEEVIQFTVKLALDNLANNPKTLIVCGSYTIGKERIFTAIAKELDCKICVTRDKKSVLDCLEDEDLARRVSLNWDDSGLHVLPMNKLNLEGLQEHLLLHGKKYNSVLAFEPTGWTHKKATLSLHHIKPKFNRDNIKIYGVPYSEHSSFLEMKRFVQFTKPEKILPTVNNGNMHSRRKMEVIFAAWMEDVQQGRVIASSQRQSSIPGWAK